MSVITVLMIIIDIIHFIFIYNNELQYYLVESEGKMFVKSKEEDDLKWMQQSDRNIL